MNFTELIAYLGLGLALGMVVVHFDAKDEKRYQWLVMGVILGVISWGLVR